MRAVSRWPRFRCIASGAAEGSPGFGEGAGLCSSGGPHMRIDKPNGNFLLLPLVIALVTGSLTGVALARPDRPKDGRAGEWGLDPDPTTPACTVSFDFSCTDASGHEIDAHGW